MKKMMVKTMVLAAMAALLAVWPARASDAVEPATVTFTNVRDEAIWNISDVSYYEGSTLLFTNCAIYSGNSTSSVRQGLVDVTLAIRIGSTATSTLYAGTADVASNGTYSCSISVPTNSGTSYIQLKLTDVNTNSYIYPWKILNRKQPL